MTDTLTVKLREEFLNTTLLFSLLILIKMLCAPYTLTNQNIYKLEKHRCQANFKDSGMLFILPVGRREIFLKETSFGNPSIGTEIDTNLEEIQPSSPSSLLFI